MYQLLLAVSLLALSACSSLDTKADRQVVRLSSPQGQVFYHMPVHDNGVTDIAIRIAWPTNWARTQGSNPAVPYVGADLVLSGGTAELKPQEVIEKFNDSNTQGSISPGPDYVIGELVFPRKHTDDTVRIAGEMLANPQLDNDWLERIKQGLITNQRNNYSLTATQMWSAARLAILGDTPLLHFLDLSDYEMIDAITRADVLEWHKTTFTKSVNAVVVTGAVSPQDAGELVDRVLQGLPDGEEIPTKTDEADFSPVTVLLHVPEAEKTTLGMIGQLPPIRKGRDREDILAVNLLSDANGPLFDVLRTELRATYGLQAGFTHYTRELRPFLIFGEVDTDKLATVVSLTLDAYEQFRLEPDLAGLEELKKRIMADARKNLQYVDVAAQAIQELALDGLDPTPAPALYEQYDLVTPASLKARLQDAFPPAGRLIVMAVSPVEDALPGACIITAMEQVTKCR